MFVKMANRGSEVDEVSYTTLIVAFAQASDLVREKRIFDMMISISLRANLVMYCTTSTSGFGSECKRD